MCAVGRRIASLGGAYVTAEDVGTTPGRHGRDRARDPLRRRPARRRRRSAATLPPRPPAPSSLRSRAAVEARLRPRLPGRSRGSACRLRPRRPRLARMLARRRRRGLRRRRRSRPRRRGRRSRSAPTVLPLDELRARPTSTSSRRARSAARSSPATSVACGARIVAGAANNPLADPALAAAPLAERRRPLRPRLHRQLRRHHRRRRRGPRTSATPRSSGGSLAPRELRIRDVLLRAEREGPRSLGARPGDRRASGWRGPRRARGPAPPVGGRGG